jgi:ABC-type polysaccharide/polyol phosphate export permease
MSSTSYEELATQKTDAPTGQAATLAGKISGSTSEDKLRLSPTARRITKRPDGFIAYLIHTLDDLWRFKFALVSFIVNKLRKRYQRSLLGFGWSLLNPFLTMCVLTAVFSLLFSAPPKTYALYVISGLLPWTFMRDSIALAGNSIVEGEMFHKKANIPKIFFPLISVSTEGINFVLSIASFLILGLILGIPIAKTIFLFPALFALTFVLAFGAALLCSVATVYFRDLTHIINVVLNALFYFTPIIYSLDQIPDNFRHLFLLNPFYYPVMLYRNIIYDGTLPRASDFLITMAIAAGCLLSGLLLVKWRDRDLIFRL